MGKYVLINSSHKPYDYVVGGKAIFSANLKALFLMSHKSKINDTGIHFHF